MLIFCKQIYIAPYTSYAKIQHNHPTILGVRVFSNLHNNNAVAMVTNGLSPFSRPPLPPYQVWCPSVHKQRRRILRKFPYVFLVKCGQKPRFSSFHGNPLHISRRQYFSCHSWSKTDSLVKTPLKLDQN